MRVNLCVQKNILKRNKSVHGRESSAALIRLRHPLRNFASSLGQVKSASFTYSRFLDTDSNKIIIYRLNAIIPPIILETMNESEFVTASDINTNRITSVTDSCSLVVFVGCFLVFCCFFFSILNGPQVVASADMILFITIT